MYVVKGKLILVRWTSERMLQGCLEVESLEGAKEGVMAEAEKEEVEMEEVVMVEMKGGMEAQAVARGVVVMAAVTAAAKAAAAKE